MRYTIDTEFIDDGERILLLSIGIVAEDGREYYAVVADLPLMQKAWWTKSGGEYWLRRNVLNKLPVIIDVENRYLGWDVLHPDFAHVKDRETIAREVVSFLRAGGEIEMWAWFGAYDHVAFSQLFGRMIDLPLGFPMWTNDIKQEHRRLGYPRIPEQAEGSHNALEDARWNWSTLRYLEALDGPVRAVPEGPVAVANPKRTRVW